MPASRRKPTREGGGLRNDIIPTISSCLDKSYSYGQCFHILFYQHLQGSKPVTISEKESTNSGNAGLLQVGTSSIIFQKFHSRSAMKVKQISAGTLTNFEVLDFLRSRGAATDPTRGIAPVEPSEFQVYDYLVPSAACNQTRQSINEFLKKCEKYDLAKAEKLSIINIRPSSVVEFQPILEECEKRMTDEEVAELTELVVNVLPPPPTQPGTEDENMEENTDG